MERRDAQSIRTRPLTPAGHCRNEETGLQAFRRDIGNWNRRNPSVVGKGRAVLTGLTAAGRNRQGKEGAPCNRLPTGLALCPPGLIRLTAQQRKGRPMFHLPPWSAVRNRVRSHLMTAFTGIGHTESRGTVMAGAAGLTFFHVGHGRPVGAPLGFEEIGMA